MTGKKLSEDDRQRLRQRRRIDESRVPDVRIHVPARGLDERWTRRSGVRR